MLKKFKTKKGKEMVIRYLCEDDTKDLFELHNSLLSEKSYVSLVKVTLEQKRLLIEDSLEQILKGRGVFLVALYDNKVLGIASIKKGRSPFLAHRGRLTIMLDKKIQGEGVGTELLKYAIKEAKKFLKIKMITLRVYEENRPAIHLYEKLNFKKVGKIEKGLKHFSRYKNEIIMVKYI
ncbi:MAG: GNAT family protein [Candidatus Paceibacterota bacterium]